MKYFLMATVCVLVLAQGVSAQGTCQRHAEPVGGFSYCVPDDWGLVHREGQKYRLVFGPRGDVFTPNINFNDEENAAPLAAYVSASIKHILENYQQTGATSVKVLGQSNFATTAGTQAIRVILSTEYKGLQIRALQYYFKGKAGQKLIVTCTALEAEKATLDPLFDRALKTFQVDK